MTTYIESSAAVKLFVDEAESEALEALCEALATAGEPLVSSALLETELRRAGIRLDVDPAAVVRTLDRVALLDPDRALFHEAGILPGEHLRSLDAVHVAAAVRAGATTFLTYDDRQRDAALAVGLVVAAPA